MFGNIKFLLSIKEKARSRKLFKNVTSFRRKQIPLMLVCEGEETFLNEILSHRNWFSLLLRNSLEDCLKIFGEHKSKQGEYKKRILEQCTHPAEINKKILVSL